MISGTTISKGVHVGEHISGGVGGVNHTITEISGEAKLVRLRSDFLGLGQTRVQLSKARARIFKRIPRSSFIYNQIGG